MHLMGRGRYKTEGYPAGAPPTFGIPNEILRYYFTIDDATPTGATYTARPWTPSDAVLVATVPPPDFNIVTPVPPCMLLKASLNVVTINDAGAITGDDITIQWRGILGENPVIAIPAPALGASQTLIDTDVVGAVTSGDITVLNYDFSDVVVPLGGGTIFPDITIPANLNVTEGGEFICFFTAGILWNASLINEPFGPLP